MNTVIDQKVQSDYAKFRREFIKQIDKIATCRNEELQEHLFIVGREADIFRRNCVESDRLIETILEKVYENIPRERYLPLYIMLTHNVNKGT